MSSIEERVTNLEEMVFKMNSEKTHQKDWRRTVGKFKDDPIMDQVIDEALRARQDERNEIDCHKTSDDAE